MLNFLAILAHVLPNSALSISIKVVPPLLFTAVILTEWYTSSVLGRAGLLVVVVSAVISILDLTGRLPVVIAQSVTKPLDYDLNDRTS
jgi:hypothetical protein